MKQMYILLTALFMSIGVAWGQTSISSGSIAAIDPQVFTGSPIQPSVTVTVDGNTLTPGTDYSVSYTSNTNVGTANVTVTGINTYTGTLGTTFSITALDLSGSTIAAIPNQQFTGSPIEPALTVNVGSLVLVSGRDFTPTYSANTSVGTASVSIQGSGNYTGTQTASFTIQAFDLAQATIAAIPAQTYTGAALEPALTVTANGKTLVADTDYTVAYSNNTAAGNNTASAVITGTGNYTGTQTVNFTISPADISSATIAPITAVDFTGSAIEPALTVTNAGQSLTAETDYTVQYTNNTNAGQNTAVATITGTGNYTGTKTANFTINPLDISTATVAAIADQTYTGSAIEPELNITLGGKTLTKGTDYTVQFTSNVNVGANTAVATITGTGNYTGTLTANFTIQQATITASSIQPISAQQYTGQPIQPLVVVKVGDRTLVANTDYTLVYSNNTDLGNQATVTVTGMGNYTGTASAAFEISENVVVPPLPPVPGDSTQNYTITLDMGPGITSNHNEGSFTIGAGSALNLQFKVTDSSVMRSDIIFLINNQAVSFQDGSEANSYVYNGLVNNDQTVQIGLRKNMIVIPMVQGATFNPAAGTHFAETGQPFRFSLTLSNEYDQSDVKVYNGTQELQRSNTRSTTYDYVINNFQGPIMIRVEGVERNDGPSSTAEVDDNTVKVYSSSSVLYVETTETLQASVYSVTGQLKGQRFVNGTESFDLPKGIYVVKVGDQIFKIYVKG